VSEPMFEPVKGIGDHIQDLINERDALRAQVAMLREALADYGEHTRECARQYFDAGEPTADGGYRQRFSGIWYEAKPVDRTPKCNCGLDTALAATADAGAWLDADRDRVRREEPKEAS
jgi:hypothetical protein